MSPTTRRRTATHARKVAIIALLALAATGCGRYLRAAAAVVDGQTISIDTLDTAVNAQLPKGQQPDAATVLDTQRKVLAQMIQDRIVAAEAREEHITIPAGEVDSRFQQVRSQFQTQAQFEQALRQQGIDPTTVKERIRLRLVVERIQKSLESGVKVTAADIKAAYGNGSQYKQVHARHILFGAQTAAQVPAALKKAKAAEAQLRGGADFATLAKQQSEDPGSKSSGGDLGWLSAGQTVAAFERVAFALKPGQISAPVQSQFGYHIIQVIGVRGKTLAQATAELRQQLQTRKAQQAFQDFLSARIVKADIQVNPRFGTFDVATLQIVPKQFFVPASPSPQPESVPGLSLGLPQSG